MTVGRDRATFLIAAVSPLSVSAAPIFSTVSMNRSNCGFSSGLGGNLRGIAVVPMNERLAEILYHIRIALAARRGHLTRKFFSLVHKSQRGLSACSISSKEFVRSGP